MGEVVWSSTQAPFGLMEVNEDPDGDGETVSLNFRFPGQYFDAETGLYHNYFRYYDPSLGRYITSDPIGLAGGMNTYSYVNQNPLNYYDPYGLYVVPWFPLPPLIPGSTINGGDTNYPPLFPPSNEYEDTRPLPPRPSNIPQSPIITGPYIDDPWLPKPYNACPPDEPGYDNGGGKNAKHSNPNKRAAAEKRYLDAKAKYERLKSKPNKTKEDKKLLLKLKNAMEKAKRDMDFAGEHHHGKPNHSSR